jgi:hypothetical protein
MITVIAKREAAGKNQGGSFLSSLAFEAAAASCAGVASVRIIV